MPKAFLTVLLLAGASAPLAAQTGYYARLGASGASRLITDEVIQPITTRQSVAPALFAGVDLPLGTRYGIGIEGELATGGLHADETTTATRYDLGHLTTGSATVSLIGPLAPHIRWRAGVGVLKYFGGTSGAIFQQGGPLDLLVGAGADWRRPAFGRWDVMVSARYDYHRFTTAELQSRGFANSQGVHRVSLSVGLAGGGL